MYYALTAVWSCTDLSPEEGAIVHITTRRNKSHLSRRFCCSDSISLINYVEKTL